MLYLRGLLLVVAFFAKPVAYAEEMPTYESFSYHVDRWNQTVAPTRASLDYILEVNRVYDATSLKADSFVYEDISYRRSWWAFKVASRLIELLGEIRNPDAFSLILQQLISVRTLTKKDGVDRLVQTQRQLGNTESEALLWKLLTEHADPDSARQALEQLHAPAWTYQRLGPPRIKKFRPQRGNFLQNLAKWLDDPEMQNVTFIANNPDHIRYRGLDLRSGDIGLVRQAFPGDGILDGFLEEPGPLPHAVMYVTRRNFHKPTGKTLYQPSILEIYADGWRSVPLTTALSPHFVWYSEWVRPRLNGKSLGPDLGKKLSEQINVMEEFAFDFKAQREPDGGYYSPEQGGSRAMCTVLIRLPFIRSGFKDLPFPTTKVCQGAQENLRRLGLDIVEIHTPKDILLKSGYKRVGIIDNGFPFESYAQALVVGRPEQRDTIGGWFANREIIPGNLPGNQLRHIASTLSAGVIAVGQSDHLLASGIRATVGVDKDSVPKTASPAVISFYLQSELEAGEIVKGVCKQLFQRQQGSDQIPTIQELRHDPDLQSLIETNLRKTKLEKERWYQ